MALRGAPPKVIWRSPPKEGPTHTKQKQRSCNQLLAFWRLSCKPWFALFGVDGAWTKFSTCCSLIGPRNSPVNGAWGNQAWPLFDDWGISENVCLNSRNTHTHTSKTRVSPKTQNLKQLNTPDPPVTKNAFHRGPEGRKAFWSTGMAFTHSWPKTVVLVMCGAPRS